MIRPGSFSVAWVVPVVAALLGPVIGCSSGGEQQLLSSYFRAASLRDSTTLANIALVNYTEGVVQSFDVINVSEEQRRPLKLRELSKVHDEAREAEDEFTKRKKEYQDANLDAIDRVLKAERANGRLSRGDAEVQQSWAKWRDETAQNAKRVAEARSALADERSTAELSVYNARNPIDVTQYDGELVTKDVTIAAKVREESGAVVDKNLVITLQRTVLKKDGQDVTGRWIIAAIKEAGPQPTS